MHTIKLHHLGQLLDYLLPGSVLLTANKRLSNKIANIHHDHQIKQKNAAWHSLNILPLMNWLERCYESALLSDQTKKDLLLNSFQETIIWQNIIQNESTQALLNISETARFAQQAWQLLHQYEIDLNTPELNENPDSEQFVHFAKQFRQHCDDVGFLDTANLPRYLTQCFKQNTLTPPNEIHLIGFIELTPDLLNLFDMLSDQDCKIYLYKLERASTQIQTISFKTTEDEIITMARFAKQLVKQTPDTSIGCIVHRLNENRANIERIFTNIFQQLGRKRPRLFPGLISPARETRADGDQRGALHCSPLDSPAPLSPLQAAEISQFKSDHIFNLSSGTALLDEPMIYTALNILSMIHRDISVENISHVLRSPFLADAEQQITNRAQLETAIRKLNNPSYTLAQLINLSLLNENEFLQHLKAFQQLLSHSRKTHLPSDCMQLFSRLLTSMGWPGERVLNSREYQTLEHWKKLLDEFRSEEH